MKLKLFDAGHQLGIRIRNKVYRIKLPISFKWKILIYPLRRFNGPVA